MTTAYGYTGWLRLGELEPGEAGFIDPLDVEPLEAARRFLGAPYEWGGLTRRGIDCSGLVHIAYRLTGRLVPRDSWQLEYAGRRRAGDPASGSLLTYGRSALADHIAFWVGDGFILHATNRDSLGVVEEPEPAALRVTRRQVIDL